MRRAEKGVGNPCGSLNKPPDEVARPEEGTLEAGGLRKEGRKAACRMESAN
jgi:hypothetical protein